MTSNDWNRLLQRGAHEMETKQKKKYMVYHYLQYWLDFIKLYTQYKKIATLHQSNHMSIKLQVFYTIFFNTQVVNLHGNIK